MGFRTEQELFDAAIASHSLQHLVNLYWQTTCLVEPTGLFGIPDLVIAGYTSSHTCEQSIFVLAFEMKLSNWKRALAQAFRYRAFAEMSFVILDSRYISRALKQIERFHRANVGLLSADTEGNLRVHYQPIKDEPFCNHTRATFERNLLKNAADGMTVAESKSR